MRKYILLITAFCSPIFGLGQSIVEKTSEDSNAFYNQFQAIQNENDKLKSQYATLKDKISNIEKEISELKIQSEDNSETIIQISNKLGTQINENKINSQRQLNDIGKSLGKKTFLGILGIFIILCVSTFIFLILRKRQVIDKTKIIEQLKETKHALQQGLIKEFEKQTELLTTQLTFFEKAKSEEIPSPEIDHSLPLKVANEINLIERNLDLMDVETRGIKQLKRSVEKLKDNLSANGYEIIELKGQKYHPGLPVIIVNSNPDENLEKDHEVISKILIPAVRYNDKMIQSAHIEVNIGV